MGLSNPNSTSNGLHPRTHNNAPEGEPRAHSVLRVEHRAGSAGARDESTGGSDVLGPHPWRKAFLIAGGLFCFTFLSSSLTPRPSTASHNLPNFHPIDLVPAAEAPRQPETGAPKSAAPAPSKFRAGGQAPESGEPAEPQLNLNIADPESDAQTVRAVFHAEQAHGVPLGCLTCADFLSFIHAGSGNGFETTRWSALDRSGVWTVRHATADDFYRATGLDLRTLHADTFHDCCGEH